jgi:hypothetical protein
VKRAPEADRDNPPSSSEETLGMSKAVACRSIDGYEDYEPLPEASLTSDEKLLIYYRPLHFRVERAGHRYQAHLTQDGRLRRKGQKAVLSSKDKMLDYGPRSERPFDRLYLRSMVSLKGLKPGEYEFEIILHDRLSNGPPATQTLPFRVVPPGQTRPGGGAASPEKGDTGAGAAPDR